MSGARSKCHRPPTPAKMLIWRPRRLRSLGRVAARHFRALSRCLPRPTLRRRALSAPPRAPAHVRPRHPAGRGARMRREGARRFVAMRPPPLPRMPRRRRPRAPRRWVGAVAAARTPPRAPSCRIRRRTGTACTATRTGRTRTARSAARSTTRRVASRASCPRRSAGASCTATAPRFSSGAGSRTRTCSTATAWSCGSSSTTPAARARSSRDSSARASSAPRTPPTPSSSAGRSGRCATAARSPTRSTCTRRTSRTPTSWHGAAACTRCMRPVGRWRSTRRRSSAWARRA